MMNANSLISYSLYGSNIVHDINHSLEEVTVNVTVIMLYSTHFYFIGAHPLHEKFIRSLTVSLISIPNQKSKPHPQANFNLRNFCPSWFWVVTKVQVV